MNFNDKQISLINKINSVGEMNNPPYRFKEFAPEVEGKGQRVIIELFDGSGQLNRLITEITRKQKKNFYHHHDTDKETERKINLAGQRSIPNYEFVCITGEVIDRKRIIRIKNVETGEIADRKFSELVDKGRNPWRRVSVRREEKIVHPQFKELALNLGLKLISHEKFILPYVRPDFVFQTKKNDFIIVELKGSTKDKIRWSKEKILRQERKYLQAGKDVYGENFKGVYMISPDGTNGCLSFEDLKTILIKKKFI